jgi:hypothetical protein
MRYYIDFMHLGQFTKKIAVKNVHRDTSKEAFALLT